MTRPASCQEPEIEELVAPRADSTADMGSEADDGGLFTAAKTKLVERRAVLGTLAAAAFVVACDGPEGAAPDSTVGPDSTVVRPDAGRFPDSLPLFENEAAESTTSTTTRSSSPTSGRAGEPNGGGGGTTSTKVPSEATTSTTSSPTVTTATTVAASTPLTTASPNTTAAPTTAPATTAAPTTVPPPPPPPPASALLLANRATFGTTPQIESDINAVGIVGWVDQQLARTVPDPTTEGLLSGFRTLLASRQQMYAIAQEDGDPIDEELVHSTIVRARYSTHQLFEMMAHLWMDHFNIRIDNGRWDHLHIDYQENVIRPNAMGRFEDLLRATAESPAMLYYLDNAFSNANSSRGVNENYGRELLELHTLGIDPQGNQIYDETDVRGASYIMSGWSVVTDRNDPAYTDFLYRSNYHWTDPVSILGGGFSSNGLAGKTAGDALITYLAHHPTTARHISYKLIRRFVTDTPPESLIASAAQVFLQNDTALVPTLRHILLSPEFAASAGLKMRRPFELLVAAMRTLGTDIPTDPLSDGADTLFDRLRDLNHVPWTWEQPDGFADESGPWLSSDGLLERWAFTSRLANNFLGDENDPATVRTDLALLRGVAVTVGDLLDDLQARFGLPGLSASQRAAMVAVLGVAETDAAASLDDAQIGELASFMLAHPQYQLR